MASIHTPPQTKHKKQDFSHGYVALMTTSPANRVISSRRIIVWLARRTIRHLHYQWCVTIGLLFCLLSLAGVAISPLWRHPTTSQAWPPSSRPPYPPRHTQQRPVRTSSGHSHRQLLISKFLLRNGQEFVCTNYCSEELNIFTQKEEIFKTQNFGAFDFSGMIWSKCGHPTIVDCMRMNTRPCGDYERLESEWWVSLLANLAPISLSAYPP